MGSQPGRGQIDDSFLREIRIGLTVVAVLLLVFAWIAWMKYSGRLSIGYRESPVAQSGEEPSGADASSTTSSALLNSSVQANRQTSYTTLANQSATSPSPGSPPLRPEDGEPRPLPELLPGASGGAFVEPQRDTGAESFSAMPNLRTQEPPSASSAQSAQLFSGGSFRPEAPSPVRPSLMPPAAVAESQTTGSRSTFREPPRPAVSNRTSDKPAGDSPAQPDFQSVAPASFDSDATETSAAITRTIPVMPPLRTESNAGSSADPAESNAEPSGSSEAKETDHLIQSTVHPRVIAGGSDLESHKVNATNAPSGRIATSIVVQQGDSFWQIAQRVYGDGRYYKALHAANQNQFPSIEYLAPGSRIAIPEIEKLKTDFPDLCPAVGSTSPEPDTVLINYQTVEGDTLFGIARDKLGQASRYTEIWRLNRDRLPEGTSHQTKLEAGLELVLPGDMR
jgi:nucleoid-associated protein YgaU